MTHGRREGSLLSRNALWNAKTDIGFCRKRIWMEFKPMISSHWIEPRVHLPLWGFARTLRLGIAAAVLGARRDGSALSCACASRRPSSPRSTTNVDGVVSEEEFLAAVPGATSETFASADVNGDTVLTPDEYEAMAAMMQ